MTLDVDPAGVDLGWVRSSLQFHPPRDVFLRFERPTQALRVWPPCLAEGRRSNADARFLCMPRIACSPPGPHPHPISDGRKLATHDTTTANDNM